jgi:hypothetical protein
VWIFFIFRDSKIRLSPIGIVSSISSLRCRLSSDQRRHATTPYYASFLLSQDKFVVSASSFDNASSCRLPSRAETNVLNLHRRRQLRLSDHLTHTLYYYRKVISTLTTLPTT